MIDYRKHTLSNGLTVIAHRDRLSQMAAFNLIYRVGARNEDPQHTGFAHLFEHLMFRGTARIPDFDRPLQEACGENNAFTNNDYTDYYIVVPVDNLSTAFWLESDRMGGLRIDEATLEAEKRVVVEEFNQRYLNQPYGDQPLLLRELAYTTHPYRWPTIGRTPDHVRAATLDRVRAFYDRYYVPANAILSVVSGLEAERVFALAEEWFGALPAVPVPVDPLPVEPVQTAPRRLEVERRVPAPAVWIAYHMASRTDHRFYACDVATDLLAGGTSSRLYERLVRGRRLLAGVNAYVTGELDPGLLVCMARPLPGVSIARVEEALLEELARLIAEPPAAEELEKVRNKFEANTRFGELNVLGKAMNLGFYEMAGDLTLVNAEPEIYRSISADEVSSVLAETCRPENSSTLVILPENEKSR